MLGEFLAIGKSNYSAQARRGAGIWAVLVAAAALWTGAVQADTVTAVGDTNNVATNTAFNTSGSLYTVANANGGANGNNTIAEWSNGLAPRRGTIT